MRPSNLKTTVAGLIFGLFALTTMAIDAAGQVEARDGDRPTQRQRGDRGDNNNYDRADRYRVYRGERYFQTDGRGADLLRAAISEGYRQGYAEGMAEREGRGKSDWSRSVVYKRGSYGYEPYVDRGEYRYYFRQGFARGYQDGFNDRNDFGYDNGARRQVMVSVFNQLLTVVAY